MTAIRVLLRAACLGVLDKACPRPTTRSHATTQAATRSICVDAVPLSLPWHGPRPALLHNSLQQHVNVKACGRGPDDRLHLVVEIKGYRGEDAKDKKATMEQYWVPGVNNLGAYGRWALAELTEVFTIESDFEAKVKGPFDTLISILTATETIQAPA